MSLRFRKTVESGLPVAFIHIGKNAGSSISLLSKRLVVYGVKVIPLKHTVRLSQLPRGLRYFFSIRHPISRFKSGFYSRKRKGKPLYSSPWSTEEERAFKNFEHANELAEALFRTDKIGNSAIEAIQSIAHISTEQIEWFTATGGLYSRPPVWIIRQEEFETDFNFLLRRLNLGVDINAIRVLDEDSHLHANVYDGVPELSTAATDNLNKWYARDVAFYEYCVRWMVERQNLDADQVRTASG